MSGEGLHDETQCPIIHFNDLYIDKPNPVFPTLVELAGLPDVPARCETELMSLKEANCTEGASLASLVVGNAKSERGATKGKVRQHW